MSLVLDDLFDDVIREILRHYILLPCRRKTASENRVEGRDEFRGPLLELGLVSHTWRTRTVEAVIVACKAQITECNAIFVQWQFTSPYHLQWIYRRMRQFTALVKIHPMVLIRLCLPPLPLVSAAFSGKLKFVVDGYLQTPASGGDEQDITTRRYVTLLNAYQSWGMAELKSTTLGWYDVCHLLYAGTEYQWSNTYVIRWYPNQEALFPQYESNKLHTRDVLPHVLRALDNEKKKEGETWIALGMLLPYTHLIHGVLNSHIAPCFSIIESQYLLRSLLGAYYGMNADFIRNGGQGPYLAVLLELYAIDPDTVVYHMFPTFRKYLEFSDLLLNPMNTPEHEAVAAYLRKETPGNQDTVGVTHWREIFMDPMDLLTRSKRKPNICQEADPALQELSVAQWRFQTVNREYTSGRCNATGKERTVGLYNELVAKLKKMLPILGAPDLDFRLLDAFIKEQRREIIEDVHSSSSSLDAGHF
jgi:hypothetical protein